MNFDSYWQTLLTIKIDSDVEQYYDEMLRPLFRECTEPLKDIKVVPTYDTRRRKEEHNKKFECITGSAKNLVWPDYIFVPSKYTHDSPLIPYAKVEFKSPNIKFKNEQMIYYSIYKTATSKGYKRFKDELTSELLECPLILTDGITWLFLNSESDLENIESENELSRHCFIDKGQRYYNGHYVKIIQDPNQEFEELKKTIVSFLKNAIAKKTQQENTIDIL